MSSLHIKRSTAAAYGRQAVAIGEAGHYVAASGARVDIADGVARAASGTLSYPPGAQLAPPAAPAGGCRVEVVNETTLSAARRLCAAGLDVAALNFASAKNPGGGFLGGARAQEESLARSSALYACIATQPMYEHHRALHDALYTSWVLYSPRVPVFRDDEGALIDEPYAVSFLTCPAVNAKVVLERDPGRRREVRAAMAERVARVLHVAAAHGHDALVLGAWGCGVFGNEPAMVADLFADALEGEFRDQFAVVSFAIVDEWHDRRNIGPFERRFAARADSPAAAGGASSLRVKPRPLRRPAGHNRHSGHSRGRGRRCGEYSFN